MTLFFQKSRFARRVSRRTSLVLELLEDRRVLSHAGLTTLMNLESSAPENTVEQSGTRTFEPGTSGTAEFHSQANAETQSGSVQPLDKTEAQQPSNDYQAGDLTTSSIDASQVTTPPQQTEITAESGNNAESIVSSPGTQENSAGTLDESRSPEGAGTSDRETAYAPTSTDDRQPSADESAVDDGATASEAHAPVNVSSPPPPTSTSTTPWTENNASSTPNQPRPDETLPNNNEESTLVTGGDHAEATAASVSRRVDATVQKISPPPGVTINAPLATVPSDTHVLERRNPGQEAENTFQSVSDTGSRNGGGTEAISSRPVPNVAAPMNNDERLDDLFENPASRWMAENSSAPLSAGLQIAGLFAEVAPFDSAALETALRDFLDNVESGVLQIVQPEIQDKWMSWIALGAVMTAAFEFTRRQTVRPSDPLLLASAREERLSGLRYRSGRPVS